MDAVRHNRIATEDQDHRSLGTLLRDLRDETSTLLRQEVALAKTEMSEKASLVGRNVAALTAGGAVAFLGAFFLLFAATAGLYVGLVAAGLTHATSGWLAPLLIGAAVTLIGYILVQKAISTLRNTNPVPEQTKQTLQENQQWLEQKVS
jgi:hypothetical protein